MSDINYERLVGEMIKQLGAGGAFTTKAVSSTPTAVLGHGPGGLFSTPGMSQDMFSAMILPRLGLQAQLPIRATVETTPIDSIITGVTGTSGSNPTGPCDAPKVAGVTKLCNHGYPLGLLSMGTKVFDVKKIGKITNRGEFTDYRIFGNALDNANPLSPTLPGSEMGSVARREISKALFELAVAWIREFAGLIYTGSPTNNTADDGYMEFYGLESLVNTGYKDVVSGNACAAADSLLFDFGSAAIESNAQTIVRMIQYAVRNTRFLAGRSNLAPVEWKLVGSYGLFYALTEIWPITYSTYRESGLIPTGATLYVDSNTIENIRQDMRGNLDELTGQYLLVDGQKVPFIIDDSLPETDDGGAFISDLYYLPFTVLGRTTPVLFLEYFNYEAANGSAIEFAREFAPLGSFSVSDAGRFFWVKNPPTQTCVQMNAWTEPRLKLLTPYLAARIQNIKYQPLLHERAWDPSDPSYFVNGGRYTSPLPNPSYSTL